MEAPAFCFGGIDKAIEANYHVVRFIHAKDLASCKSGRFLVGSIDRNKKFDDARCDKGEASIDVVWENKAGEEWIFEGDDCKRYVGILATEKFQAIRGTGGITLKNQSLVQGNPLSLSAALLPKKLSRIALNKFIKNLRKNLGMPDDAIILRFKLPNLLLADITEQIMRKKIGLKLIPLSGKILYAERVVIAGRFIDYKNHVSSFFHNSCLNLDYLFTKPVAYSSDCELRVLWVSHSGPHNFTLSGPVILDYQNEDFIMLDDVPFDVNFEIIS